MLYILNWDLTSTVTSWLHVTDSEVTEIKEIAHTFYLLSAHKKKLSAVCKPDKYICNLMNHTITGTLIYRLQDTGWN